MGMAFIEVPALTLFRQSPGVAARLRALLDRQDAGEWQSPEERAEAEGLVELGELLSLLRLSARRTAP
jgi:hypothetical protein